MCVKRKKHVDGQVLSLDKMDLSDGTTFGVTCIVVLEKIVTGSVHRFLQDINPTVYRTYDQRQVIRSEHVASCDTIAITLMEYVATI